ncbi:Noc3 like protein [Cryptosporidium ryanae]|uniref:Noc3 like protein n=1 Tax=Cryptosporidium ryanae TaxID=515981 RepID=UPI00351A4DA4|nr:Noc3 like protein [Cryptosporidium ryanae]
MSNIEERYERKRRFEQFSKWSEKADSSMGLPVFDVESKGWLIPKNSSNKKRKKSLEKERVYIENGVHDNEDKKKVKGQLSRKNQRRLKELEKKELSKKKKPKNHHSAKLGQLSGPEDDKSNGEKNFKIKQPRDLAAICDLIMSDSETNIAYLSYLLDHSERQWVNVLKGLYEYNYPFELIIVSLVLVVKDLTPGYKISNQIVVMEMQGNENKVSLKKETQKIHSYEIKMLEIYKKTCLLLKRIIEQNKRANGNTKIIKKETILKVTMDLLDSTYHFNHHIILLRVILLYLMSASDRENSSCLNYCCEGMVNLLNSDTTLEIGVESVNIIHEVLFKKGKTSEKRNAKVKYKLNRWILYPFIKYTPWNRIEESKSEYRRIFGTNKNNISQELIDELQQTSSTRIKYEALIEREEIILKHLFTFYAKVFILDLNNDLEQVFLGIAHYSNRINQNMRSELISILREKMYKSESMSFNGFVTILKCCFSLIQKGLNLTEHQLEDNSWVLKYLIIRLEKERQKINKILKSDSSTRNNKFDNYLSGIVNCFDNPEFSTLLLNVSIFSNSSHLYHLLFTIGKISLELFKAKEYNASLSLIKICGRILINYPKLRTLLDQEGVPFNEFPVDSGYSSSLSLCGYQEISLYYILKEIIEHPNSDSKLKLACNLLLSESTEADVKKFAITNIKSLGEKEGIISDTSNNYVNELKPLHFAMKLVNM